jgi:hypothetical protein
VIRLSDRLYVDPVTHSAREERALFELGKKLGKSVGQFYRLGIISYCRIKAEDGALSDEILDEFNKIMQKDPDYLERLKQDRINQNDICQVDLLVQVKEPEPDFIRVWDIGAKNYIHINPVNFDPRIHER